MKTMHTFFLSLMVPFTQVVSAHPGHGLGEGHGNQVLHPFLGPDHLLLIAAVGVVFLLARKGLSKKPSDRDQE